MVCEWEEIMLEMVLLDRYEIKKPIAKMIATDIRKLFEVGMADFENLLQEKYEPALKPEKYS